MSIFEKLAAATVGISFEDTAKKDYAQIARWINTSSYSMLSELHRCPRKWQLIKSRAAGGSGQASNVDFAYGHAVGAGVQAWLMSKDIKTALFNAFLAWNIPYGAAIELKKKTIVDTWLAVTSYASFHEEHLEEWRVFVLPNGKPAIEISAEIDFENGYKHYLHIDVILENTYTGQLAIQENKTHGFNSVEAAIYANSMQALSYGVIIDMLRGDTSYEVFYACYSAPARQWDLLPFTKTTTQKAEWIKDVQLDHAAVSTYRKLSFFPKRGESCYDFGRRCEFFGDCGMVNNLPAEMVLPDDVSAEKVDYKFKVSELIQNQLERNRK